MNKQAFTFLTLFTMVLLLAVYYVTLPLNKTTVDTNDLIVSQGSSTIEGYQNSIEEKHQAEVQENEEVLSNGQSSTEEKLEALKKINETALSSNLEKQLIQKLAESSFEGCLVEIEEEVTRVVCPNTFLSKENAALILNVIYQNMNRDQLVEVTFQ